MDIFSYEDRDSDVLYSDVSADYDLRALNWYMALDTLRQERQQAWEYVQRHWVRLHARRSARMRGPQ